MLEWLKSLFVVSKPAPQLPAVVVEAHPITLNPSQKQALLRNLGRLNNLYNVRPSSVTPAIVEEIAARKAAIVREGHPAPQNSAETLALFRKVQGE